jgi:uncharacterized protein YcgI (DUF1989 family)
VYSHEAGYQATPGGPLDVDKAFYARLALAGGRRRTQDFEIPIRSGAAWEVPAGSIVRISIVSGPQVGDFNVWSLDNPRERFWAARTRQLQRNSVTTYDRLWSCLPYLRPMLTVTADTLEDHPDAIAIHDLLGSRCDPYVNRMLAGTDFDYHCHSNLVRAVQPYGLTEFDVHDVLNIFQFAGANDRAQYFFGECPARKGDYFEFFAEIDLLCALSTCPGGDLSVPMWGPEAASAEEQLEHCHPLGVEVFEPEPGVLEGWRAPMTSQYQGRHGRHALRPVPFEATRGTSSTPSIPSGR